TGQRYVRFERAPFGTHPLPCATAQIESTACGSIACRIHFCIPAFLLRRGSPMAGNGDFQVTCRICNKPLKLGIDTAADEDGKALHETCYVKQVTDAPRSPPAELDARAKVRFSFRRIL